LAALDEFVAEMGAYADEIVIDLGALEIDLEEETEFEFKDHTAHKLALEKCRWERTFRELFSQLP
jgi:hypothetical protein